MSESPATVGVVLQQACTRLMENATEFDSPRLDAELLLAHVLERPRSFLFAYPEQAIDQHRISNFQAMLERRLAGEPLAYIVGEREFWSLALTVEPGVLIPRPETELLVEQALLQLPKLPAGAICDAGTGSGAIIVALFTEWRQTPGGTARHWLATDNSSKAIAVAARNVDQHAASLVALIHCHWLDPIADNSLALLVSNPPYLADDDSHLGALRHEPREALVAAERGLADYAHLMTEANRTLVDGGVIMVEHGLHQASDVRQLMRGQGFEDLQTFRDLEQRERVTMARRTRHE